LQGYHLVLERGHRRPQPLYLGPQLLIGDQRRLELLTQRDTSHTTILSATPRAVVDSHAITRDPPPERLLGAYLVGFLVAIPVVAGAYSLTATEFATKRARYLFAAGVVVATGLAAYGFVDLFSLTSSPVL